MSLEDLQGSTYGPFPARVTSEQVSAYVAATGDDAARWVDHAPPSFAGALLFAAAPSFLFSEEVRPYTKLLVHADQQFTWYRAIAVGEALTVEGVLSRVRTRGGVSFVTFEVSIHDGDESVIDARSTFLMGDGRPADQAPEEQEPPIDRRGAFEELPDDMTPALGPTASMARSASRLDLVRYAAASGDFNPVHFDHETAVRGGFPGVLVHGLLMGAWLLQLAAAHSPSSFALSAAKLRFRNPLRPGVTALAAGDISDLADGAADVRIALTGGETVYVDGRATLRLE